MNLLYDNQIFSQQKFGGISRYFVELMKHMPDDVHVECTALLSDNFYLRTERFKGNHSHSFPHLFEKKKTYKRLNELSLKYALKRGKFDLFHPTYFDPYFLKNLKKPYVITVHDMTYERFPELFGTSDPVIAQKRESIVGADKIIAISEKTKADIMDIYNLSGDNIEVIYHGYSINPRSAEGVDGLPEHYVLYVGQRYHYKNFERFLRSFAVVNQRNPEVKLVCTGQQFNNEERKLITDLRLDGVVTSMFVTDNQLAYLYSKALCFVFPSLYEGFGIPILESMACGCPVALSDASCFPEVAGEAAVYFNPYEIEDMAETIWRITEDSGLRKTLIAKGLGKAKDFSWEKTAIQTAGFYKR